VKIKKRKKKKKPKNKKEKPGKKEPKKPAPKKQEEEDEDDDDFVEAANDQNVNVNNNVNRQNPNMVNNNANNIKINSINQDGITFDDSNTKNGKNEIILDKIKNNSKIHSKEPTERYAYLKVEDTSQERINLSRKNLYSCVHISGEERIRLLNYQNNFISRIECLSNFKNLIFLDFFNNNIEKIQGLENLCSLRVLMLGRNKISKIEGLSFVTKLDILDLHNNEITEIENLNQLTELRILNLEDNKITELTNLNGLISLTDLNLKNNNISVIRNIPKLNNLKKLCLSGNKLKNFYDIDSLSILHVFDISFENNPMFNIPLYRSTMIYKFKFIKLLDGHRVSEEERRLSYKITRKEEEKRKENERLAYKNEEKKKCLNNIQEVWKQKMKIIESNKSDNGVIDLKCLKVANSNPFNQSNTIRENGTPNTPSKTNSSFSSLFSNKSGSKDSNISTSDSNSNSNIRRNKIGSTSSNSHSLLNLYNGNNSESTIHYSSSNLLNSRDSLSGNSRPMSSRTYFNINKNIGNKGRNIMNSSNQKLITANDIKNDSLTSYIEQDKDEIRVYGDINVNFDKLDATGIKTIRFNYIHINNIIDMMHKLKKFTDLKKLIFSNNDFSSLNQLHSFSILRNIEEIDILSYDNPIVEYDHLLYYILYRLKHLPLKVVCKKEITETDYENAELMFAGLQKVILKIPTNIIYHTSDLSLPINFTGTVCPMIKQYKSKYMNLETLASLRKNKLNNNTNNNNNNDKTTNNKNDTVNNKTSDTANNDDNSKTTTNTIREITPTPPSYMKNVIQQYVQLNSLFVMVTQENISIRNKLMESGSFLKHNQFFSLSINNDTEAMEMNYNKCKKDAKNYVDNLLSKCKKENEKSELFSKVFSSILADGCRTAIQKSKNINQTMEEALINIIQNTRLIY